MSCPACYSTVGPCACSAALIDAANVRNSEIDAACKAFAKARDENRRLFKPGEFREAMRPYERALDAAKDAAWAKYKHAASAAEGSE